MANESVRTLVDSNVLLDIATDDEVFGEWSAGALATAINLGAVHVNPIVYAEVSVRFDRIEDLDSFIPESTFRRESLPFSAGFVAGKAFAAYRRRGGERRSPLPDFYIGAHAAVGRYRLLTRDATRYRTYFPTLELHSPDRTG